MKRILCGALSALLIFTGIQLPARAETAGTEETAGGDHRNGAGGVCPGGDTGPRDGRAGCERARPAGHDGQRQRHRYARGAGRPRRLQLPHGPDAGGEQREQLPLCKRPDPDAAAVRCAGLPAVQLLRRALGLPRDPAADGRGLYRGQHGQCVVLVGQRGGQLFFQNARAAYPRAAGLFLWRLYRKRE